MEKNNDHMEVTNKIISNVNISLILKQFDEDCAKVENRYSKHITFFERATDLFIKYGPFIEISKNEEFVKLLNDMREVDFITVSAYNQLMAHGAKSRKFGLITFPFWQLSKTVVEWLRTNKTILEKRIDENTLSEFDKRNCKKFLLVVWQPCSYICEGSVAMNEYVVKNLEEAIKTLSINSLLTEVPAQSSTQSSKFGVARDKNIADVIQNENNTLSHIFASNKCPGGGIFSLFFTFGGQEEIIFQSRMELMLIAMYVVGDMCFDGEESGKCVWKYNLNPQYEMISFKISYMQNNWVSFLAMNDQREKQLLQHEQLIQNRIAIGSLLAFGKERKLIVWTGEVGCGIYNGDKNTCIDAIIASSDSSLVVATWMQEWYQVDSDKKPIIENGKKVFINKVRECSYEITAN